MPSPVLPLTSVTEAGLTVEASNGSEKPASIIGLLGNVLGLNCSCGLKSMRKGDSLRVSSILNCPWLGEMGRPFSPNMSSVRKYCTSPPRSNGASGVKVSVRESSVAIRACPSIKAPLTETKKPPVTVAGLTGSDRNSVICLSDETTAPLPGLCDCTEGRLGSKASPVVNVDVKATALLPDRSSRPSVEATVIVAFSLTNVFRVRT